MIDIDLQKRILQWIKDNYNPRIMDDFPSDWDQEREFYYRPDIKKNIQYGPIKYADLHEAFPEINQ